MIFLVKDWWLIHVTECRDPFCSCLKNPLMLSCSMLRCLLFLFLVTSGYVASFDEPPRDGRIRTWACVVDLDDWPVNRGWSDYPCLPNSHMHTPLFIAVSMFQIVRYTSETSHNRDKSHRQLSSYLYSTVLKIENIRRYRSQMPLSIRHLL